MSKYTKEDIWRMIEEEDVEFIRLQFTDIFGTLKNVAVTTSQLERVLNNEIMFDGASIEGFARVEQSDMFLRPDLDTFAIFPWRPQQGKVAFLSVIFTIGRDTVCRRSASCAEKDGAGSSRNGLSDGCRTGV